MGGQQRVTKFFTESEVARRYHAHRPRVHEEVVREVWASRAARKVEAALDVACGTGHSTSALKALVPTVYACDVSLPMLACAREAVEARFVACRAEALPFVAQRFDLITVSMALHWFDQRSFLEEVGRVLAPAGEMWVYNLFFPGLLIGDDRFSRWHRERYLTRYPIPPRHTASLAGLLDRQPSPLVLLGARRLHCEVTFTAPALRDYLTTQSNIEAALARGELLEDVSAWLDAELAPFFRHQRSQRFAYPGRIEIATAIG